MYGLLADLTVAAHFLWVLFLIFGAAWGRKNRTVGIIHLCGLALAFFTESCNWICPVTDLEGWLRSRHGIPGGYTGSFLSHYLERLLYVDLPRSLIVGLTIALCAVNVVLYRRRTW